MPLASARSWVERAPLIPTMAVATAAADCLTGIITGFTGCKLLRRFSEIVPENS
jgi:hypothetical protein